MPYYSVNIPVYNQYALQAFKANSVDCLLKPIDADELQAAIDKFKRLQQTTIPAATADIDALIQLLRQPVTGYKDRSMVSIGPKIQSLTIDQIANFFYDEKATWLQTHDGRPIAIEYSLDKLTTLLDSQRFFRVNRAFLIAHTAIKTVQTYSGSKLKVYLQPESRQKLFVSGDQVTYFKAWLGK